MKHAKLFTISSPAKPERLQAGVTAANEAGFDLSSVPDAIFSSGYLAGDDQTRGQSLRTALTDPSADFAWAIRGGYGAARTPLPAPEAFKNGLPLLGFSDLTFLLAVAHRAGGRAIHGPVLTSFADADEPSRRALFDALMGKERVWHLKPSESAVEGTGTIVGGNLTVLATLLGTEQCPRFENRYVVLEDVGEAHYRLDRAFNHLMRASDLAHARGILIGHFQDCPPGADELVAALCRTQKIPCWTQAPVGHGNENHAFIWGEQASMDQEGRLLLHGS